MRAGGETPRCFLHLQTRSCPSLFSDVTERSSLIRSSCVLTRLDVPRRSLVTKEHRRRSAHNVEKFALLSTAGERTHTFTWLCWIDVEPAWHPPRAHAAPAAALARLQVCEGDKLPHGCCSKHVPGLCSASDM